MGIGPLTGVWVITACVSDFFDGFLARYLDVTSELGKILDALADKIFVLCIIFLLVIEDRLPQGMLVLMGFRDLSLMIASVVEIFKWGQFRQGPLFSGKIYITLAMVMITLHFFESLFWFKPGVMIATVIVGFFSWVGYFKRAFF